MVSINAARLRRVLPGQGVSPSEVARVLGSIAAELPVGTEIVIRSSGGLDPIAQRVQAMAR